ncbi:glycine receptor subunit alpha-2-like protein [Dinothrombium tinctorium]|uniref:Glycine receptor subunit alpha-2-like protein n=1 Tax=Dinothrombium tinctorium TaxID=1965070 RepID=A0A3S3SFE8_9ACAR|nr:glycine receptor subunit alpha-2-like protein [Dinothrombium tinctorium]
MDFQIMFRLRQQWHLRESICNTYRRKLNESTIIKRETIFIGASQVKLFWSPDTFFPNAIAVGTPSEVNNFNKMKLKRDQRGGCVIEHNSLFTAKVGCQMNLRHYPSDIQTCVFKIRSFANPSYLINYQWERPVEVDKKIQVPVYELSHITQGSETLRMFGVNYSSIYFNITFQRQIVPQLIHIYAPSTLLVVISWFSFWMGLDAIPGRITLSVTSLLALVTYFGAMRKELPATTYVNGSDIWMIICMLFVFSSLLQFSIVNYINTRSQKKMAEVKRAAELLLRKENPPLFSIRFVEQNRTRKTNSIFQKYCDLENERKQTIDKIENASRIIFPLTFALWNILYWPLLLNRNL